MWVFSESSTGAKGNGYGSKSKLLHFHNPYITPSDGNLPFPSGTPG
jgi:hypothetical protein